LSPLHSGLHDLYQWDYALIRPDHYIAWCGDSLSEAIGILPIISGKTHDALV